MSDVAMAFALLAAMWCGLLLAVLKMWLRLNALTVHAQYLESEMDLDREHYATRFRTLWDVVQGHATRLKAAEENVRTLEPARLEQRMARLERTIEQNRAAVETMIWRG